MQKTCKQCGEGFEITEDDFRFLEKFTTIAGENKYTVPAPDLCPDCRRINRLIFRNEKNLYFRKCDMCQKPSLSWYHPDAEVKAYCPECYWSDKWDGTSFGRDFDFGKPFFEQFESICRDAPKMGRLVKSNENSDYVSMTGYCKDCYLLLASEYDEGCMYGKQVIKSKDCLDVLECFDSENCYECTDIHHCYGLLYSSNCANCNDSMFLYGCRGCSNCLFCSNLRNQSYCVFNKPVSKDEYEIQKKRAFELKDEYERVCFEAVHKNLEGQNNENSVGDFLTNCKDCFNCFDLSNAQDCRYEFTGFGLKDAMDVCHATDGELGYQCMSFGYHSYNSKFGVGSWTSNNLNYFYEMHDCSDCFGCSGLIRKKYCILNKQYTKEEYKNLLPKIIEHMQKTLEWGQFLPVKFSPFAYNESHVFEYFSLSKEEVLKKGFKWRDPDERDFSPSTSSDVLACESCKRNYKLVPAEIAFYKRHGLSVPKKCFYCRHENRMKARAGRKLFDRACDKCGGTMKTTYKPEYKGKVYCESCYLKEIY